MNRISKLKNLLKEKKCLKILEAHSGLSGLIVEDSQFDGIWESSLTDSGSKGLPDTELVTMDSRLNTIRQIAEVTTKPIIVDGDTGGQVDHFPYWVKRLQEVGVSAVIIEDKSFPKKNSLDENAKHKLEDINVFSNKIKAGIKAKINPDFMIIARLESLIVNNDLEEAKSRALAFLEAGVDGIMIHSKLQSPVDVINFAKWFHELSDKVLVCVPTAYNDVYDKDLERVGFNVIIHANHMLRASFRAMKHVTDTIYKDNRSFNLNDSISTVKEIFKITGYDKE